MKPRKVPWLGKLDALLRLHKALLRQDCRISGAATDDFDRDLTFEASCIGGLAYCLYELLFRRYSVEHI